MAQHITMIMDNPKSGLPEAFRVEMTKLEMGALPKHMAGPFRYRFEIDTGNGPCEFSAVLMMNDQRIQVAFEEFPVMCKIADAWTTSGPIVKVAEFNDPKAKDHILRLKASLYGKSHIWIDIDKGAVVGGLYDSKTKVPYALPFWNFYGHGAVCLGALDGNLPRHPLKALNMFLSAYTTPHITMTDRNLKFKPNKEKTQIVCDKVPACALFDWPVNPELFNTPIGTITP